MTALYCVIDLALGDNRDRSNDLRRFGYVAAGQIEARAYIRLGPFGRSGPLSSASAPTLG